MPLKVTKLSLCIGRHPVWLIGLLPPQQADETLNFEEQILEAAKSIAAATSALVKSASAAQRELVAQGKVGLIPANAVDDGQWSQGLISAVSLEWKAMFMLINSLTQQQQKKNDLNFLCFSLPGAYGGSGDQQLVWSR